MFSCSGRSAPIWPSWKSPHRKSSPEGCKRTARQAWWKLDLRRSGGQLINTHSSPVTSWFDFEFEPFTVLWFIFPGLCVYFGYGIWHSKEGLRELQPKDMAARYVVLPSGSLVETVQSVQPEGQADMAHHISASSDSTVEESTGRRWYVTKCCSVPLPLVHFNYLSISLPFRVFHPTSLHWLLYASTPQGAMHAPYLLWSIFVYLVLLECKVKALLLLCSYILGLFCKTSQKLSFEKWESRSQAIT